MKINKMRAYPIYIFLSVFVFGLIGCVSTKTPEQKAYQDKVDSIAFVRAVDRLEKMDFLIPAQSVQINNNLISYSGSGITNFVAANNGTGTVQIASTRNPRPGANGLGGVTLSGPIKLVRSTKDKRGNVSLEYAITGSSARGHVYITVPYRSIKATVRVTGNFSSNALTIKGEIEAYDSTKASVGRSI